MNTPELFYESWLDALKDDVRAIGGAKIVGCLFWPEKDAIAARNKLNDALNEDRRERLTDEQERMIMRMAKDKRGFSSALYYLCDDAGFDRPKARDPHDEQAALQRQFIESVRMQERIAARLEAMTQPSVRSVRASA